MRLEFAAAFVTARAEPTSGWGRKRQRGGRVLPTPSPGDHPGKGRQYKDLPSQRGSSGAGPAKHGVQAALRRSARELHLGVGESLLLAGGLLYATSASAPGPQPCSSPAGCLAWLRSAPFCLGDQPAANGLTPCSRRGHDHSLSPPPSLMQQLRTACGGQLWRSSLGKGTTASLPRGQPPWRRVGSSDLLGSVLLE